MNVPSEPEPSSTNIQSLPPHFEKSRLPALEARLFAGQVKKTKRPVSILKSQAKFMGSSLVFSPTRGNGDYWWKKGLIRLDWDGMIDNHTIAGCNGTLHPSGCTDEQDLYMISSQNQYGEIKNTIDVSHGLTRMFTGHLKSKYNSNESLAAVLGITPYYFKGSGKYDPAAMISQLARWQTVAHGFGHSLQLPHYTTTDALAALNPNDYRFGIDYLLAGVLDAYNNLTCGINPPGTTIVCPDTPNTDLMAGQIIKAHWGAVERSK